MKEIKDLELKIFKKNNSIIYVNFKKKIMLEKKENVIKNINYAEEFNEKSKEIGDWVYEHIFKEKGIGEGIIATC